MLLIQVNNHINVMRVPLNAIENGGKHFTTMYGTRISFQRDQHIQIQIRRLRRLSSHTPANSAHIFLVISASDKFG